MCAWRSHRGRITQEEGGREKNWTAFLEACLSINFDEQTVSMMCKRARGVVGGEGTHEAIKAEQGVAAAWDDVREKRSERDK